MLLRAKMLPNCGQTTRSSFLRICFTIALLPLCSPAAGQLRTVQGDLVNDFPVRVMKDVVRGQKDRVRIRFKLYLPGRGGRYLPIGEELAAILVRTPSIVAAPEGVTARVVQASCKPAALRIRRGSSITVIRGGDVQCEVEVETAETLQAGDYSLKLSFDSLKFALAMLEVQTATSNCDAVVTLKVWESAADAQAAAKSRMADQSRRKSTNSDGRLTLKQAVGWACLIGFFLVAAGLLTHRSPDPTRQEYRPSFPAPSNAGGSSSAPSKSALRMPRRGRTDQAIHFKIKAGNSDSKQAAVARQDHESTEDPGTVLETIWAQNVVGNRQRIKIETVTAFDPDWQATSNMVDVVVSVGVSVPAGEYKAKLAGKDVRVTVPA